MKIVINGIGVAGPALGVLADEGTGTRFSSSRRRRAFVRAATSSISGGSATTSPRRWASSARSARSATRYAKCVSSDATVASEADSTSSLRPHDPRSLHEPPPVRRLGDDLRAIERTRSRRSSAIPSRRIEDTASGVRVTFDHAPPREADLVIGADGLHSRVRQLAFGPESEFESPRSATTSRRSRSKATARATSSSTSATDCREGRSRASRCATTRRSSSSCSATST